MGNAMTIDSVEGESKAVSETDLLQVSSFAFLNQKAHLAYLSAKAYATKRSQPVLVQEAQKRCDSARTSAFQSCSKNARSLCAPTTTRVALQTLSRNANEQKLCML